MPRCSEPFPHLSCPTDRRRLLWEAALYTKERPMTALIHNITFDCADPYGMAGFWGPVTGYQEGPQNPNEPDDPEAYLASPDGHHGILFIAVPESKAVKNRVHLDLMPTDRSRDEELDRLLGLGASLVADHRRPDGTGWAVLTDPEGNEFCVERSAAERAQESVTTG